ncbi:MAG: HoxN/HupN/NixA family nickel/cobalt transporter [Rhodococcus erythropolis]|nr:HoxN/HupN/NixA family nickel/cobalt transporter [Rhodococcus erythropolis]
MTSTLTSTMPPAGAWTGAERRRLAAIVAAIIAVHLLGIAASQAYSGSVASAGGLAGAGLLAYTLGVRHAFDADHIAAIDDTTRLMLTRGKRPVGVGFFFAMGHSTVVFVLALIVGVGASSLSESEFAGIQEIGGLMATVIAIMFLLLVAGLNSVVLRNLIRLSRRSRAGADVTADLELTLSDRGLFVRLLGTRLRGLIRSSWHMYPVGLLMGLGLETASEVTLLALTASAATSGALTLVGLMSLPLLFAAGMSTFDTADSLFMTRAYSWSYSKPLRRLYFNTATTAVTVVIGFAVAGIYLCALLSALPGMTWLSGIGALSEQFELLGYTVVALFVLTWIAALVYSRVRNRLNIVEPL